MDHNCPQGWGAFGFDHRAPDWAEQYWMYPNQAATLTFRFNPGADPASFGHHKLTPDLVNDTDQPLER